MFMLRIQIIRNSSVEGVSSDNAGRMKLHTHFMMLMENCYLSVTSENNAKRKEAVLLFTVNH